MNILWSNSEQGNSDAQYYRGMMYYDGDGVKQDYVEAVKWLEKSAVQGHPEAQYYCGLMYRDGQGVEEDHLTAMTWFKRASDNGIGRAKSALDWTRK